MILLDRIAEIGIALAIILIFFFIFSWILFNTGIEMVENKLNNISISCSSEFVPEAITISIEDSVVYCLIEEKPGGAVYGFK